MRARVAVHAVLFPLPVRAACAVHAKEGFGFLGPAVFLTGAKKQRHGSRVASSRAPPHDCNTLPTSPPQHVPRRQHLPRRRAPAHARARRAQIRRPRRDHDPRLERGDGTKPPSRETRDAPDVSSSFSARFASSASLRPSRRADARAPVERGNAFARLPRVSVLDANVVVVAFVSLGTRRKTPSVDRRKCFFFGFPKHRRLTPPRARRGSPRVPRRYRSSRSSRSSPSSRRAPRCARWRAGAPSAG
jgi:hypothetical protein